MEERDKMYPRILLTLQLLGSINCSFFVLLGLLRENSRCSVF